MSESDEPQHHSKSRLLVVPIFSRQISRAGDFASGTPIAEMKAAVAKRCSQRCQEEYLMRPARLILVNSLSLTRNPRAVNIPTAVNVFR